MKDKKNNVWVIHCSFVTIFIKTARQGELQPNHLLFEKVEKCCNKILCKDPNLHFLFQDHQEKTNKSMEEIIRRKNLLEEALGKQPRLEEANLKKWNEKLKRSYRYHKTNYQNRSIPFFLSTMSTKKPKRFKLISGRQTKPMQNLIRAPNQCIIVLQKGMSRLSSRQQSVFVLFEKSPFSKFPKVFSRLQTYHFSSYTFVTPQINEYRGWWRRRKRGKQRVFNSNCRKAQLTNFLGFQKPSDVQKIQSNSWIKVLINNCWRSFFLPLVYGKPRGSKNPYELLPKL